MLSQTDHDTLISLLESLPLLVVAKDREGRYLCANDRFCSRFSLDRGDVVGRTDFDIHPPKVAERYRLDDIRVMAEEKSEVREEWWAANDPSGLSCWVRISHCPLRSHERGKIIGTLQVFAELDGVGSMSPAHERETLHLLLNRLAEAVYVKGPDSRFLLANEPLARLFGVDRPEHLLGRTETGLLGPAQSAQVREDEKRLLAGEQPVVSRQEEWVYPDGSTCWLNTRSMVLTSSDGEVTGILGISTDITREHLAGEEIRRLKEELVKARRMEQVGTLTAGIAHDFNNLLSVITGYAELMQLGLAADSAQREHVGRILSAGRRAAKLAGKLLAFSRNQAAQARSIDLNRELERMWPAVQRQAGEGVVVLSDLQESLWPVRMDSIQLEQLINILVTNSCEAMAGRGELYLTTRNIMVDDTTMTLYPNLALGDWVALSVVDSGPGIAPEIMEHIFEPFFTTKPQGQGNGLGLATAFGIVKQHNGQIVAENGEDSGARFSIFLRRVETQDEESPENMEHGRDLRGSEKILVVEDDTEVRNLVRTILEDYGYTVHCAGNGAEAILRYEQLGTDIDLILTDIIMPGMNGKVLADEILRRSPEALIMFMSGYTGETVGQYGILETGRNFIQKPFSPGQLAARVRDVLDNDNG